jgi:ring-1,2-phenylacetyl-CoA epoxidase subunit PaaD
MVTSITNISSIRTLLEQVTDPEIPVLSIIDLGIVRDIHINGHQAEITITPTYNGCPAIDVISINIRLLLLEHGFEKVSIKQVLSPAWTTDWMSEAGKQKLSAYGIAPPNPVQQVCNTQLFAREEAIACPQCGSFNTRRISEFGSTACKALYQCNDCQEPFDYFKCH